jgi:hypothetical protein
VLVALDTPYADTAAADLRFALGLPPQPALRTLEVTLPGGEPVLLRLLGASHQVRFRDVDETVAYLPAISTALPAQYAMSGYTFAATVRRLGAAAFEAECAALRRRAELEEQALAGVFPGARDALTVLAARAVDGGAAWWTPHAYPQTREQVLTETTVTTVMNA